MILRSRHKFYCLGFLHLMLILSIGCKTHYTPVKAQFGNIKVTPVKDTIGYSVTEKYLKPYRQKLQDSFSTVIATTTGKLVKKRPGGSLGNLVTSVIWSLTEAREDLDPCVVVMNYGGIRLKELPKGNITIRNIYELLPFENTVVKMKITGDQLYELLKQIKKTGGWPIRYDEEIKNLKDLKKFGQITLFTNNYLAAGGDNCTILKNLPQEDTGLLLRDLVLSFWELRKNKIITPDETNYILK